MTFVNLTSDTLNIYDVGGRTLLHTLPAWFGQPLEKVEMNIFPEAHVARVDGFPVGHHSLDMEMISELIFSLSKDDYYIVPQASAPILVHTMADFDIFMPGPPARNANGRIVGCIGLLRPGIYSIGRH